MQNYILSRKKKDLKSDVFLALAYTSGHNFYMGMQNEKYKKNNDQARFLIFTFSIDITLLEKKKKKIIIMSS